MTADTTSRFAREGLDSFTTWLAEREVGDDWQSFEQALFEWLQGGPGFEELGGSYEALLQLVILWLTDIVRGDRLLEYRASDKSYRVLGPDSVSDRPWQLLFDRGQLDYARVQCEKRWVVEALTTRSADR